MRKAIALLLCAGLVNCSYARKKDQEFEKALVRGAQMKMVLRVHDDEGIPVKSAKVHTAVENLHAIYNLRGETDTNGICVVEGVATGNRIEIFIEKDGYYKSHRKYCFITMGAEREVKDGKWQPYGETVQILLRKKLNPIYIPHEWFWRFNYTTMTNLWIGYDIHLNDFLDPIGKGVVSDFELKFDWDGRWLPSEYTGMGVSIRFKEPFSGYYECDAKNESEFRSPYSASTTEQYEQDAEFYERIQPDWRKEKKEFDSNKCWIVRSRCQVDENGKLERANYSVIYGVEFCCKRDGRVGFCLTGAFNPTPNDTNLEAKQ